jgi:hypothetical protein
MRDERPNSPDEPDTGERDDPPEEDDMDSAPTRGGSNVPNAGRDSDEGRTE